MDKVKITLGRNDVQKIIAEFTERMASYAHTARVLRDEDHNLENFLIEEVEDADEADRVADNYRRIVNEIAHQIA
jgi:hypothetical protein